jgi:4-cresol dehydrogenase (hydroxylating)
MRLPPGIAAGDFAKALREFEAIVGKEWVFTSDEDLDLYRDAYSPLVGEPEERIASAAVAPDTVEQVQKVVKVANAFKIPIYPISTGKNLGYGGSAPVYSGSVVIDLKRMNRILEVNEDNGHILVEPGVSYFDMYRHLQEIGSKLWLDVPDPGWGSLIGNAMDRGGGYTMAQFRNHFDAHCGMEVVLANGEVMRTGMGALPGAKSWQEYKTGFGPWVDGVFSQSNFGIVTKMGFWLMPQPEAYLEAAVYAPRYQDLSPLIRILNLVENSRICNGMPDLGSPLLNTIQLRDYEEFFDHGPAKRDEEYDALVEKAELGYSPELEAYALRKGIPYWSCTLPFYGPAEVIAAQWKVTREKFSAIPGVTFKDKGILRMPLTEEQKKTVHLPDFGIPSLKIFSAVARSRFNPTPSRGHMGFSPIIPRTGEAVIEVNRVFAETLKEMNIPVVSRFNLPACYWERAFMYIFLLPVSEDVETNKRNRQAFLKLIKVAAERGWGEYRTAPVFQDAVADVYSFGDHALRRFNEKLKDAIDPNGIISPGRYGIWPKHLREARK